jgi:hypothetical protein
LIRTTSFDFNTWQYLLWNRWIYICIIQALICNVQEIYIKHYSVSVWWGNLEETSLDPLWPQFSSFNICKIIDRNIYILQDLIWIIQNGFNKYHSVSAFNVQKESARIIFLWLIHIIDICKIIVHVHMYCKHWFAMFKKYTLNTTQWVCGEET